MDHECSVIEQTLKTQGVTYWPSGSCVGLRIKKSMAQTPLAVGCFPEQETYTHHSTG